MKTNEQLTNELIKANYRGPLRPLTDAEAEYYSELLNNDETDYYRPYAIRETTRDVISINDTPWDASNALWTMIPAGKLYNEQYKGLKTMKRTKQQTELYEYLRNETQDRDAAYKLAAGSEQGFYYGFAGFIEINIDDLNNPNSEASYQYQDGAGRCSLVYDASLNGVYLVGSAY